MREFLSYPRIRAMIRSSPYGKTLNGTALESFEECLKSIASTQDLLALELRVVEKKIVTAQIPTLIANATVVESSTASSSITVPISTSLAFNNPSEEGSLCCQNEGDSEERTDPEALNLSVSSLESPSTNDSTLDPVLSRASVSKPTTDSKSKSASHHELAQHQATINAIANPASPLSWVGIFPPKEQPNKRVFSSNNSQPWLHSGTRKPSRQNRTNRPNY